MHGVKHFEHRAKVCGWSWADGFRGVAGVSSVSLHISHVCGLERFRVVESLMVILPQRVGKPALKITVRESVNRIELYIKYQSATNLSIPQCLMAPAWPLPVVRTENCKSSRVRIASAKLSPKNAP
jgi:hypothetical protein